METPLPPPPKKRILCISGNRSPKKLRTFKPKLKK